uniref:hypothetical protein n=1 Tax=uncultured Campylobacter sp. TaxID=218934 RepID=UPI00263583E8
MKTILFWLFTEIQSKELGFIAIRRGVVLKNLMNFSKYKILIILLCLFYCLNINITNRFDFFVYNLAYLIIKISLPLFILYAFIDKNSMSLPSETHAVGFLAAIASCRMILPAKRHEP